MFVLPVCLCECGWVCGDLEHNRTLLLCIDGDVGACHPGVGAQVPKSHIGVSEEEWGKSLTPHMIFS